MRGLLPVFYPIAYQVSLYGRLHYIRLPSSFALIRLRRKSSEKLGMARILLMFIIGFLEALSNILDKADSVIPLMLSTTSRPTSMPPRFNLPGIYFILIT